jgi:hypothetical protein
MPLLLQSMLTGARGQARRYGLRIVLAAAALLVASMGCAALAVAAFLFLAERMAAPAAAAVTGGGMLVVAGLATLTIVLLGRGASHGPNSPAAAGESTGGSAASDLVALARMAEAAISRDARSETPLFALVALLAGCALGASPELRRAIDKMS